MLPFLGQPVAEYGVVLALPREGSRVFAFRAAVCNQILWSTPAPGKPNQGQLN